MDTQKPSLKVPDIHEKPSSPSPSSPPPIQNPLWREKPHPFADLLSLRAGNTGAKEEGGKESLSTEAIKAIKEASKMKKSSRFGSKGFLLPLVARREQWTKARSHFVEFVEIARRTNKMLVLPGLREGKLIFSSQFPICAVIDCENLSNYVDWSSSSSYLSDLPSFSWKKDTYQELYYGSWEHCDSIENFTNALHKTGIYTKVFSKFENSLPQLCFTGLSSQPSEPERMMKELAEKKEELGTHLAVAKMTAVPVIKDNQRTEISFFNYTLPNPFILRMVRAFLEGPLGSKPFLAMHWRLERRRETDITVCVDALIEKIKELRREYRIEQLFLATDWVQEEGREKRKVKEKSSNCDECHSLELDLQMKRFIRNSGAIMWEHFDHFAVPKLEEGLLLGIFEKLVVLHSDLFLILRQPCSRYSSYAGSIEAMRNMVSWPNVLFEFHSPQKERKK